eukprot:c36562_g1_i1 orf=99-1604(+)
MEPAGVAGAGVAWPARGGPGDGSLSRRELSSPPSLEPPHKKVRNDAFQAHGSMYPSQEAANHMRGDVQSGVSPGISHHLPTLAAGEHRYGGHYSVGFAGQPPFNHSQGMQQMPGYGGQQQMQPSNGYSQDTSHASSHSFSMPPQSSAPPSGFPPGSAKGTGALFLKTKLCTKFKLGTCTFNERCHFAHGMEDLRKPPVGWETMVANAGQGGLSAGRAGDQQRKKSSKPCRFFADGKECPYGDRCTFVHTTGDEAHLGSGFGNSESGGTLAPPSVRFKTRMCARWERGEPCNYGERCHYAHGYAELQSSTGAPAYGDGSVTTANNVQYASSNLEAVPYSTQFPNTNSMNAPSAAASLGGPYSVANANGPSNAYPTAGTGVQETINDYPRNQSYWNGAPTQLAPTQPAYIQSNQTVGSWASNHIAEGGYSKDPSSAVQYIPAPVQQQPSVQPYASGNVGVYQEPKQSMSLPYMQDGNRANYQTDAMGGKGGYYPVPYMASQPN